MSRYRTIVADPPWRVGAGPLTGREGFGDATGASRALPYPSMTVAEIAALPVGGLADDAAHLYLRTINRYVEDAYAIARAWGFRPSTLCIWPKAPMGGGLGGDAFGLAAEFFLFARRGVLPAERREGRNWWPWKRPYDERGKPRHSGKPDAFYDLVEQVSPGPRLEMFARRQRLGWDTWGNEALCHVEIGGIA